MMTIQEIFDRVATHLITQCTRSTAPSGGICRYLSSDGLQCAVGVLIPRHEYMSCMEGKGVHEPVVYNALHRAGIFEMECNLLHRSQEDQNKLSFLTRLQNLHDMSNPSDWAQLLRELAARYNLSLPRVFTVV